MKLNEAFTRYSQGDAPPASAYRQEYYAILKPMMGDVDVKDIDSKRIKDGFDNSGAILSSKIRAAALLIYILSWASEKGYCDKPDFSTSIVWQKKDKEQFDRAKAIVNRIRSTAPTQEPQEVKPIIQTSNEEIKVGDNVVYGEHIGEVLSISGKKAVVALGGISSTINLNLLKKAKRKDVRKQEQRAVSALSSIETLRQRSLKFKTQLDIRGMRTDEAMQTVMYYIDDAIMMGVSSVRILHGTGTGALKQVVRDYLAERQKSMRRLKSGDISFHDGDPDRGGAGITIIEL